MDGRRSVSRDLKGTEAAEGWIQGMEGKEGVKTLWLTHCGLEEWPANLSGDSFPGLDELSVFPNVNMKEMPEGLAPFSHLTYLDVSKTGLSTLPRDLARVCPLLEWLYMGSCQFRTIPESVRGLKGLET